MSTFKEGDKVASKRSNLKGTVVAVRAFELDYGYLVRYDAPPAHRVAAWYFSTDLELQK